MTVWHTGCSSPALLDQHRLDRRPNIMLTNWRVRNFWFLPTVSFVFLAWYIIYLVREAHRQPVYNLLQMDYLLRRSRWWEVVWEARCWRDTVGVHITANCKSTLLIIAGVRSYIWGWGEEKKYINHNSKGEGYLRSPRNNWASAGPKKRLKPNTRAGRFGGAPRLLMHDRSIIHFCAFTHRWQDNRIAEKRNRGGRRCQDCGNSQIPSPATKDGGRAA